MFISTVRRFIGVVGAVMLTSTACAFDGLNSLPLPGTVGHGAGAQQFRVDIANVGTLESNSPVLLDDVVVGSIGAMHVRRGGPGRWHADVELSVRPDVVVPANAQATIGQTSLLGSMHLSLDPPLGQAPTGRLASGTTMGLNDSARYPSTEQTLSSLAAVVNGGGLGQLGEVIHNVSTAVAGRGDQIRDLLLRLNDFVGTLDAQRGDLTAALDDLARLSGTLAANDAAIDTVLHKLPPALDVLVAERPRITTALQTLGTLSDISNRLIRDSQGDLVSNLTNLAPAVRAVADVGPRLDAILASLTVFPYSQDVIDRALKGDYFNLNIILDLTVPRLKRSLLLGTRWGEPGATLVPAPGDPFYLNYTYDPLAAGVDAATSQAPGSVPSPGGVPPTASPAGPSANSAGPDPTPNAVVLPIGAPTDATPAPPPSAPIFAGPYGTPEPAAPPSAPTGPAGN